MAFAILLAACDFVHDEVLDEPYRLVAVDIDEQMAICRSYGRDCVGVINETVFQAGFDANYIVAARRPTDGSKMMRGITEFYYVVRSANEKDPSVKVAVMGPFDEAKYALEKQRLGLPGFSRVFNHLK